MFPARRVLSLTFALLVAVVGDAANAMDLGLRLDPGIAFAVGEPQSIYFGVGGALALKGSAGFGPIDFHASGLFVGLSANDAAPPGGAMTAWGVGGGLRIKRPRDTGVASPWIDVDALYIRTGPLDRFGFQSVWASHFRSVRCGRSGWVLMRDMRRSYSRPTRGT